MMPLSTYYSSAKADIGFRAFESKYGKRRSPSVPADVMSIGMRPHCTVSIYRSSALRKHESLIECRHLSESNRSFRRLHPLGKMESCRQQRTRGTRPNCVSGQCGWSQKSNTSTRPSGPQSNPSLTNSASEQRKRCSTGSGELRPTPANVPV